jgi:hypothetical protein
VLTLPVTLLVQCLSTGVLQHLQVKCVSGFLYVFNSSEIVVKVNGTYSTPFFFTISSVWAASDRQINSLRINNLNFF